VDFGGYRKALYTGRSMVRLSEIFHWMSEDERWRYKIIFQGLILLVPVIGLLSLLGWMMIICDNLRAGRQDVAPAGFHLRRGVRLFAIGVIYWVGLGLPKSVLLFLDGIWPRVLPVARVVDAYNNVGLLLYVLLIVPILVATVRGGFWGGLNPVRITMSIVERPLRTLLAAGVVLVAVVIAFVGCALIVTAPFALVYAASVVATIAAWWSLPRRGEQPVPEEVPYPITATPRPAPFRPPGVEPEGQRAADT
jgi:hypothetical protein